MYEKGRYMGFDLSQLIDSGVYTNICNEIALPTKKVDRLVKQLPSNISTIHKRHLLVKRLA